MLSVKRAIQYPASFGLEKFLIENLVIDSRTVIPSCPIAKGQVYLLKCVARN